MTVHRPILIAGPTASGKSALALMLAERLGGTIVNMDSMQVYRELRILTARPTAADEARAPHRLYGHVPAAEAYSAGRCLIEVGRVLETLKTTGSVPVLVGGTGLYFKALLEGLSPIPPIPDDVRRSWRDAAEQLGAGGLHALLADRDPAMAARLRPTDTQRAVRALEVLDATGRSLAEWQQVAGTPLLAARETIRLVVMPDRETVYARSDARFRAMMAQGALDEVRGLLSLSLSPELPAMRALGVTPLAAHLAGTTSLDAAVSAAQRDTRHYIRRQLTWLRRNMIAWKPINLDELERIVTGDFSIIEN